MQGRRQKPIQRRVKTLAFRIADILAAHPNPYEADTACAIAKSLTAMRVQLACLLEIQNESKVEARRGQS
jgi:hypothetical protein